MQKTTELKKIKKKTLLKCEENKQNLKKMQRVSAADHTHYIKKKNSNEKMQLKVKKKLSKCKIIRKFK